MVALLFLFNIRRRYCWYDVFFTDAVILYIYLHRCCHGCTIVVVMDAPSLLSWMHHCCCHGCTIVVVMDAPLLSLWIHHCSDSQTLFNLKYYFSRLHINSPPGAPLAFPPLPQHTFDVHIFISFDKFLLFSRNISVSIANHCG